jgi:hypothetical protein
MSSEVPAARAAPTMAMFVPVTAMVGKKDTRTVPMVTGRPSAAESRDSAALFNSEGSSAQRTARKPPTMMTRTSAATATRRRRNN